MFKRLMKGLLFMSLVMALVIGVTSGEWPTSATADTANYSEVVTGVQVVSFPIMGQYTATRAGIVEFKIPFKAKVLGVSATARSSGGTSPTLTLDVKEDETSILSAPFSVYSASITEGTISDNTLADESTISIDLNIGGTSPTWDDIMALITLRRTN